MATRQQTITSTETNQQPMVVLPPTLVLELNPATEPKPPKVRWTEETVDNEHMDKKKSKCCCVYTKPHDPQSEQTDSNEFDNCDHCRFHTESDYSAKSEDRQPKIKIVIAKP